MNTRIVIIGAGQAGANAAMALRRQGHAGPVVLVGEEVHLPYERPPLSKDALLRPQQARLALYTQEQFAEQDITLKLGLRATAIDSQAGTVSLANGETLAYDKLLLAIGAQPRRLPALDALGECTHVLRTLEDAQQIRAQAQAGKRALLVGAGVIGLELASSLSELGLQVDVVDPARRAMLRNSPEPIGAFLQATHEARGVRFHFATGVQAAERRGDAIHLTLDNGTQLQGDLLVYGIGVSVDTTLADSAGLRCEQGAIVVDERCRTSQTGIYAAGDAVVQIDADGQRSRIESWENANLQAAAAVSDMLDQDLATPTVPWFWTDQCGYNVQFAGDMAAPHWLLRGTPGQGPFVALGLADGTIVGAVTVNAGKDMRPAKELIARRAQVDEALLRDPAVALRELAKMS
ncbi:FAD-dependent oxidoreductase [Pseudomonas sp. S31]|uniref:3-phenylpropionate/cinnamic acid dioxygenase ferredoxin--NAD(+) reductase subunit n=1 Tax=Pseudomonas sp. S31 TaxID=1564473 RepID=UPI001914AB13|nr:3-phenylpropionate/cinnamic acid dioxygenase ferredoxin--NAD(+) reductase subunit [Pseudomonas sp. S31]MBK5001519.1 FAD-dependent oxidoreductase [Pseudomonas sp. S31]